MLVRIGFKVEYGCQLFHKLDQISIKQSTEKITQRKTNIVLHFCKVPKIGTSLIFTPFDEKSSTSFNLSLAYNSSINSSGAYPPPGNRGAFAQVVSPGGGAFAILSRSRGLGISIPGASPGHLPQVFSKDR